LARDSISSHFQKKFDAPADIKEEFSEKQGAFVTLYKNNELRGCIGYSEPIFPLYKAVAEAAQASAFSDPRFVPVTEDEIDNLKIEVSVLTKPVKIEFKDSEELLRQIKIGKDGLIIERGLLLPQVAVEYNWNAKEFLENTCMKAGLPADYWKETNVKIYKFQTQIFDE